MQFKQKLAYMVLGSVFTFLGFILANTVSNVTAQNDRRSVEFKKVRCESLEITDEFGNIFAILEHIPDSNNIRDDIFQVFDRDGTLVYKVSACTSTAALAGMLTIYGSNGKPHVRMSGGTGGGEAIIMDNEGKRRMKLGVTYFDNEGYIMMFDENDEGRFIE